MATVLARPRMMGKVATFWQQEESLVFLQGVTLYLLCFAILCILIFATPGFFSTDDYYHARISEQIIKQGRIALDFPWLPVTILSPERYVDHHMLFHILLAPGVYIGGVTGAKLVTVAIAAAIFLVSWLLFREIGVIYPVIWTMGMFGLSATFIFRMLMIRTNGFSFLLLAIALLVVFKRKYTWLILVSFLYVWLYNGWILMPVFVGCYCAAVYITERRLEWQPFVLCCIGIVLGNVINPYFPRNIMFVFEHLGAKVNLDSSVQLGTEWNPFDTRAILINLTGTCLAMVAGFIRPSFGGRRDHIETTLMFTALVTGFMAFQSMRFFEYWPGFALMFCAAAWGRGPAITFDSAIYRKFARYVLPALMIVVMLFFSVATLRTTYNLSVAARDPLEYAGSAHWLENNTPQGMLVFTVGFNDFSRLFFYNQHNSYLIGLDPTYLQYADQHMWDVYSEVTDGRSPKPSQAIAETFGIQYAISARRHGSFNRAARDDPDMQLVFRDQFTYVWRVSEAVFNAARQPANQ
jgi:hypothetical protein